MLSRVDTNNTPYLSQSHEVPKENRIVETIQRHWKEFTQKIAGLFHRTKEMTKPSNPWADALESYRNMPIDQKAIDARTETCLQQLKLSGEGHVQILRNWIEKVYRDHHIQLPFEGGHMMDCIALDEANRLLNPIVMEKINLLVSDSKNALDLKNAALEKKLPLSSLVYRI